MMEEAKFRGVDLGWMQAQWRDCADRGEQMKIFKDMTGATKGEILVALGESKEAGPQRSGRGEYLPEEKEIIVRMACEGRSPQEIADALGRSTSKAISAQMTKLRAQGYNIPRFQRGGRRRKREDPVLPAITEPVQIQQADDGVVLDRSLKSIERDLRALVEEERDLTEQLKTVRSKIETYRETFSRLLSMTNGGQGNA